MGPADEAVFARLIPVNYLAQRLLRDSVEAAEAASNAYRLKFVDKSPPQSYDGLTLAADIDLAAQLSTFNHDLVLSLEPECEPANMGHGWRIGKDSHKGKSKPVELVVAEPTSPFARRIANVAAFFRFHPRSAMLLVVAASDEKPVHVLYDGDWIAIGMREARVLYQPATRLRFGELEYELRYTVSEENVNGFLELRDDFIERATGCRPSVPWSVPPFISFEKRGSVLFYRSLGHGSFTITSRGVDSETGDLLAVKELQLKSNRDYKAAALEMQIASTCSVMDGHLPLQVSWCEHGDVKPCNLLPERFFMAFPLGVTDFARMSWKSFPSNVRVDLLLQILKAISRMHDAGYMHRDVSLKNMLLVTLEPPTAALIDYGKSIEAQEHTETRLGPIPTVAPEVRMAAAPYTEKIDIWSWAYAVAEIYGYSYRPLINESPWITEKRLGRIQKHLQSLQVPDPAEAKLLDLTMSSLSWRAADRPSASFALRDKVWFELGFIDDQSSFGKMESQSSGGKRIKQDDSELPLSPTPVATDPLSQAPEVYLGKRIKIEDDET